MTQAISANAIDNFINLENEEDLVITDVTRQRGSTRDIKQYEKWKQELRIALIREHFEAQKKNGAVHKPILLQMLNLSQNH